MFCIFYFLFCDLILVFFFFCSIFLIVYIFPVFFFSGLICFFCFCQTYWQYQLSNWKLISSLFRKLYCITWFHMLDSSWLFLLFFFCKLIRLVARSQPFCHFLLCSVMASGKPFLWGFVLWWVAFARERGEITKAEKRGYYERRLCDKTDFCLLDIHNLSSSQRACSQYQTVFLDLRHLVKNALNWLEQ